MKGNKLSFRSIYVHAVHVLNIIFKRRTLLILRVRLFSD